MTEHAIFVAALEIDDRARRSAYLAQVCGNDEALRVGIQRLLDAQEKSVSDMAEPAGSPTGTRQQPSTVDFAGMAENVGATIGRYKLLQQIGEGGMGIVFMAEQQEPVRRRVAFKLIKPGMDSRQVIARFEAERQALALMDHANIAKVFDAGATSAGLPYFVMELVKGVPITKYCDDNHLTPRERLELFLPVCLAVQHAHQKGIIHRDLKPSNVLVSPYDGKPVPKVIDFGVAKAISQLLTERTLFTQFGQVVGTMEYMSPEQAELNALDVDTRSDIYALGVLLYELFTGSTPFERKRLRAAAFTEMLRIIREEEPPKPSTRLSSSAALPAIAAQRNTEPKKLGKLMRGDLDWIVMKALDKDRARRYETANEFALDLQRYLDDEPVLAGPPTARYRLRKFVRRNLSAVIGVSLLLLTLLAGMAGTTWGLLQARAAQQKIATSLAAEKEARRRAREALRVLTDDAIESVFSKQASLGENEKVFLRKVLGFYEDFAHELGDTEEAKALRADGYYKIGTIRGNLGQTAEAESAYREALRLREEVVDREPGSPEHLQALAASQHGLGVLQFQVGKYAEAQKYLQAAVTQRKELTARFPDSAAHQFELVKAQLSLAILLTQTNRHREAETLCREALAQQSRLVDADAGNAAYAQHLARLHAHLATVLQQTSQLTEAAAAYAAAIAIHARLAARFPAEPDHRADLGKAHSSLGSLLNTTFRHKEAEAPFRAAVAAYEKLAADYPAVPSYRRDLAQAYAGVAYALLFTERTKEVEEALHASLTLREKLAASFPENTGYQIEVASTHMDLGSFLRTNKRPLEAETIYKQALALYEKAYAQDLANPHRSTSLATCYANLCHTYRDLNQPEQAIAWALKTITILKADLERDPRQYDVRWLLRNAHWGRAAALDDLKRPAEALADWDRVLEFSLPEDQQFFRMQKYLSQAHLGDPSPAAHLEEEIRIAKKRTGGFFYDIARLYALSSASLKNDGKQSELYAARAVANLGEAMTKGQFKVPKRLAQLKEDNDLVSLRGRADFQKFMAELPK